MSYVLFMCTFFDFIETLKVDAMTDNLTQLQKCDEGNIDLTF